MSLPIFTISVYFDFPNRTIKSLMKTEWTVTAQGDKNLRAFDFYPAYVISSILLAYVFACQEDIRTNNIGKSVSFRRLTPKGSSSFHGVETRRFEKEQNEILEFRIFVTRKKSIKNIFCWL